MWLVRRSPRRDAPSVSLGPVELISAYAAGLTLSDIAAICDLDVRDVRAFATRAT